MKPRVTPPGAIFAGVARLAFFNPSGFAALGNTTQAFLSSLAPLVAFLFVFSTAETFVAGWRIGLTGFAQTLCVLLGQPVASHALAKWWKRDAGWARYATAMNWCQFAIPVMAAAAIIVGQLIGSAMPSPRSIAYIVIGAVFAYALLLHWFLARHGLGLSSLRAAMFVLCVNLAIGLVLSIPTLARVLLGGQGLAGLAT